MVWERVKKSKAHRSAPGKKYKEICLIIPLHIKNSWVHLKLWEGIKLLTCFWYKGNKNSK